jgi:uncharacterized protein (UPF0276 family)
MAQKISKIKSQYLGCGIGLRSIFYQEILEKLPAVDWFEIITEDFLVPGGRPLYYLDQVRQHYPIVMHGVSLSIGGTDPLNFDYLTKVKLLAQRVEPKWISDHFCWTGVNHLNMHDLLPLPHTEEAINHVVSRINQVQEFLGRQILLENVSSYITYNDSCMSEWEFINEIITRADCKILLDINNIYVSSVNHSFDPYDFLNSIPKKGVQQFHLAGHTNNGVHLIDTHDMPIIEPVWELYVAALRRFGKISTLIERDDNFPPLDDLLAELNRAKKTVSTICDESVTC